MLLSGSCLSSQSSQPETIRLTLKSSMLKASHIPCKTHGSKSCSMSQESRTECLTQKKGQCFRPGGKSNYSLHTKKTPCSQRHAFKPCSIKVESWGLEHFAQFSAATLLNGNDFSRHGEAGLGQERRGQARHGLARQTHCISSEVQQFAKAGRGMARPGAAGHGKARRGLARQTHGALRSAAACQCKKTKN